METLEALSARLNATDDIRSIVRTMKALSSASIHQFERAVEAMETYDRTVTLGLQIVLRDKSRDAQPQPAPASAPKVAPRHALIAIGSDRGLCGRFNDRIAGFAAGKIAPRKGTGSHAAPVLCVLGLRTAARLEALGHRADRQFTLPGTVDGLARTVQTVAVEIERWIRDRKITNVSVSFNRRAGAALGTPVQRPLFPVPKTYLDGLARAPWQSPSLPIFRMEREKLYSWLVSEYLFVVLYRSLAESIAAEHASRLAAMHAAERNIDERRDEVLAEYRKTRQETITRELLDLVSGYEALQTPQ